MPLSRKDTLAALETVKAAVAVRSAIQELTHIWFDGSYVYATNGGLGIKKKFKTPFNCGVPGALLFGLLNQASSDTLDFEQEGNGLKLKAGRSKITLATLPFSQMPWRYPEKPAKKAVCSFKISEDFIKGLKRVAFFKPVSPKRMEHYSICIYAVEEEMDLYLTDAKSIVVMPVSEKIEGPGKQLALSRDLADQIVAKCKPGCQLNMYSDHFSVKASDDLQLFGNVFDTSDMLDFPTTVNNFANEKKFPSVAIPKELTAALERAMVLAGSEEPAVRLKTNGKKLQLSGQFRYGKLDEEFELDKMPTSVTVNMDAKTMLSVKDVKKMSFCNRAVSFFGDDDFVYILAALEAPAAPPVEETADEEEDA